jgi:hypothetical protein
VKRWRVLESGEGWKLLCDPERFKDYLQRSIDNTNGIAKFGPMQVRREPWPKKKKKK